MIINIKNYIKEYFYKIKTKIDVDSDFYEENVFYLFDLEVDKKCMK